MRLLLLFFISLISSLAAAVELEYVGHFQIPNQQSFNGTTLGALSGLVSEDGGKTYWVVSGDRGKWGEPRIYEFKLQLQPKSKKQPFVMKPLRVVSLTVNQSQSAHQSTKSKPEIFSALIDLEAISLLPWGDFLLSNTGDLNLKPPVPPQILDVKKDGTIVRDFTVPLLFLPDKTSKQARGLKGHLTFEGLTALPDGKSWMAAAESPLVQDNPGLRRVLLYRTIAAWKIEPREQYIYPIDTKNAGTIDFPRGISDMVFIGPTKFLSVERVIVIHPSGPEFQVEVYECDLAGATDVSREEALAQFPVDGAVIKPISKRLILKLSSLRKKIGKIENFEGIALGPTLPDGRKTVLLVSDDNFMRNQRTQFLMLSIKDVAPEARKEQSP
jgi:3-phytase